MGDIYIKYTDYSGSDFPSGCTTLQYIQSDGSQYIDTGYKLPSDQSNIRIEAVVSFNGIVSSQPTYPTIFGVRDSNNDYASSNSCIVAAKWSNSVVTVNYGTGQINTSLTFDTFSRYKCNVVLTRSALIIENGSGQTLLEQTLSPTYDGSTTRNLIIFSLNSPTGEYGHQTRCRMNLHRFTIYDGNTCILNYLPVLDDNDIACVYDTVSQEYVYSSGSSAFIAGEEAVGTPIDTVYLKVDGAWIILEDGDWNDVNTEGSGGIQTGTTPPTSDMGSDGDYYKQTFPLPSNVNFVEFLESSGTQYIDTGIIADENTDVDCTYTYRGNDFILGCRTGSSTSASKSLIVVGSGNGVCAYKSKDSSNISAFAAGGTASNKYRSFTKTSVLGDYARAFLVSRADSSSTFSKTIGTFIADYSQVLFGLKQGSTPTIATRATLHRVTYYQAGRVLADYLPCLDGNGVACMWDNVAKEYVYNDGTGDFTYGSTYSPTELDPILYVKENGAWRVVGQ